MPLFTREEGVLVDQWIDDIRGVDTDIDMPYGSSIDILKWIKKHFGRQDLTSRQINHWVCSKPRLKMRKNNKAANLTQHQREILQNLHKNNPTASSRTIYDMFLAKYPDCKSNYNTILSCISNYVPNQITND